MSVARLLAEVVIGSALFPIPSSRKVIFIYHDLSEPGEAQHSPYYSTRFQNFKDQVKYIQSKFKIIPLDEMLFNDALSAEKQYASFTFDDGFYSVRERALPHLKSMSIPFTIFLNKLAIEKNQLWLSNIFIEKNNLDYLKGIFRENNLQENEWENFILDPLTWVTNNYEVIDTSTFIMNKSIRSQIYLNEKDVKYLSDLGVLVGNHSTSHPILSRIEKKNLQSEILDNKLYLESLINKSINLFAIPFGKREHYNDDIINACSESGHSKILSSNPTLLNKNNTSLVPRIGLINNSIRNLRYYLNRPYLKDIDI